MQDVINRNGQDGKQEVFGQLGCTVLKMCSQLWVLALSLVGVLTTSPIPGQKPGVVRVTSSEDSSIFS